MKMMQRRLHGWRRLSLMPFLLLTVLLLVLAASLVRPGTAHAQSGATATITVASTGLLIARTTVQISATVSCTLPAGSTFLEASGDVSIVQASGQQLVSAVGFFGFFPLSPCDGTARTLQVDATPTLPSAPFHGGPATATSFFDVLYFDASGNQLDVFASIPLQVIHIQG